MKTIEIKRATLCKVFVSFALVFAGLTIFSRNTAEAQTGSDPEKITSKNKMSKKLKTAEFKRILQTVADGWKDGDARRAADCFAEDAIYIEPPDKQVYVGRKALFEFFGGDRQPAPKMSMTWHHLAFDEGEQIGFGEYTFQGNNRYHGIVIVKIKNAKIGNWREYQYRSELGWSKFTEKNPF